jgi:hypothetical protein
MPSDEVRIPLDLPDELWQYVYDTSALEHTDRQEFILNCIRLDQKLRIATQNVSAAGEKK